MATHSSILAWRIPGTEEPGGLPSMGSHRVGHDWSDLAAAAAAFGLVVFLLRNQLIACLEFLCMLFVVCHLLLLMFYLSLIFVSLVTVCLGVFLLGLSFLGLSVLPELGWLFPLPCSGSFQLLSLQMFSQVLSFFFWDPYNVNVNKLDVISEFP